MHCDNCGTPNPDGSSFCNKCGGGLGPEGEIAQQPQRTAAHVAKTDGLAIAGFVLGIASILPPFAICSIPAIILSAVAMNRIKHDPALEGKGLALAGIICGAIVLFLWVCLIIFGMIIFITSASTTSSLSVCTLTLSSQL
jgi:hypothetical protein